MDRFGSRLLGTIARIGASVISPSLGCIAPLQMRMITTTACLRKGLIDFFEKGQALPIYEPGSAPAYGIYIWANHLRRILVGRAWKAEELRLKSFEDLHRLWFVLLKERNLLATQKAEAQRLGQRWFGTSRIFKAKESMARIKTILLERQRIHSQALRLTQIKAGARPMPSGSESMLQEQKGERLRLLERKRQFRKTRRHKRRQHPLF